MPPGGSAKMSSKAPSSPDEYQVFKPLLDKPALSPIVEKKRGGKDIKMIYGTGVDAYPQRPHFQGGARSLCPQRPGNRHARQMGDHH